MSVEERQGSRRIATREVLGGNHGRLRTVIFANVINHKVFNPIVRTTGRSAVISKLVSLRYSARGKRLVNTHPFLFYYLMMIVKLAV